MTREDRVKFKTLDGREWRHPFAVARVRSAVECDDSKLKVNPFYAATNNLSWLVECAYCIDRVLDEDF